MTRKLPKYVKLGNTEMRLVDKTVYWGENPKHKKEYYRDAGVWSVDYKYLNDILVADCELITGAHELPLIEITKEEWKKGNKGYI